MIMGWVVVVVVMMEEIVGRSFQVSSSRVMRRYFLMR
jgi:hypothetical protein